jgi:hypothetical protein
MSLSAALVMWLLASSPAEMVPLVVQAPDSPVKLDHAKILNTGADPLVLLYAASNLTDQPLDQFTVIAFVFDAQGTLKARQTAPGRRLLDAHGTKYSTLVLDGSPIEPTDIIVVGVNQAQRPNSDAWWRAELQSSAEAAVKPKK